MKKLTHFVAAAALATAVAFGGSAMAQNNETTDLYQILERVTTKETPSYVSLTPKMQSLITIATLATLGDEDLLASNIAKALTDGIAPVEIRETLYQGMAYVGMSYITRAEKVFMEECEEAGVALPLPSATTVNDDNRFDEGLKVQKGIFGAGIDAMHKAAKEDEKHLSIDLLTGFCFGDTYTRTGLTPTPISMPGAESIQAALHPEKSDALYFVAKSHDPKDGHIFSNSLQEHNKAVSQYRKKVKEYRESLQDK